MYVQGTAAASMKYENIMTSGALKMFFVNVFDTFYFIFSFFFPYFSFFALRH